MALNWLPQEDIDRVLKIKPGYEEDVRELLESGTGKLDWRTHMVHCQKLAVLTWLTDENVSETRKYFRLAGEAGLKMLEEARAVWNRSCAAEESSLALECALISCDMELSKKVASLLTEPKEFRTGHPTVRWYASALKDVVLGDEALARKNLEGLSLSTKKLPLQRMGELYTALLDRDESAMQSGLENHVKWHRGRLKPDHSRVWARLEESGPPWPAGGGWVDINLIPFEFYMSIPGLAFCSLATARGMKPDVDAPYLPKALIAAGPWIHEDADTSILDRSDILDARADALKLKLEKAANKRYYRGQTPLHVHVVEKSGTERALEVLLDHGADINAADDEGKTALHVAVVAGAAGAAGALLRRGADPNLRDKKRRTPLDYALKLDEPARTQMVELLKSSGTIE